MNRINRKIAFFAALTLLLSGLVCFGVAELSTNLKIETVYVRNNQRLVDHQTYVDEAGKAVIPSDKGYATVKYTYGTSSLVTQIELLDTQGNLVNGNEGWAWQKRGYSNGLLAEQSYFDKDGNLAIGTEGYARLVNEYSAKRLLSTWTYDAAGKPVGTHRICEYQPVNGIDRLISDTWYDAENQLVAGPNGYARVEYEYMDNIRKRIAYIGADGKPWYNARAKYATMESEYDHNLIQNTKYYGAEGELIAGPEGYAMVTYQHSVKDDRNVRREMYYNADGSLFFTEKGYCGLERIMARGRVVEARYFTGENQRGRTTDGYSRTVINYTSTGKVLVQRYYDEKDKAVVAAAFGYATVKNDYEAGRRIKETAFFDEKGNPIACNDGYAVIKYQYKDGYLVEKKYLDVKGKLVAGPDGYARATYENNEKGKVLTERYFDAKDAPLIGNLNADEMHYT